MSDLSHVDESGRAHMVDVSAKSDTDRIAQAKGSIRMLASTLAAIRANEVAKGDVISVARVAGIMAAKKTAELIPLCHPIQISHVSVEFALDAEMPGIHVMSEVRCSGKTGVEMEALVAVTVALLTIYDMTKAADKSMVIFDTTLVSKSGGKSGAWHR